MQIQFAMDQLLFMSVVSGPSGCTQLLLATSAAGNICCWQQITLHQNKQSALLSRCQATQTHKQPNS
jgi:hypothetical protein